MVEVNFFKDNVVSVGTFCIRIHLAWFVSDTEPRCKINPIKIFKLVLIKFSQINYFPESLHSNCNFVKWYLNNNIEKNIFYPIYQVYKIHNDFYVVCKQYLLV